MENKVSESVPLNVKQNQQPLVKANELGDKIKPTPPIDTKPVELPTATIIETLTDKVKLTHIDTPKEQINVVNKWFKHIDEELYPHYTPPNQKYIDVQPDTRAILRFIINSNVNRYESLDKQTQSTFSLFGFIAYDLLMFGAYVLAHESLNRYPNSAFAAQYKQDSVRNQYAFILQNCKIHTELADLLMNLAPTKDPSQPSLLYLPSFAASVFKHDFGRLMTPQLFMHMHNIYTQQADVFSTDELKVKYYAEPALRIDNVIYSNTHILGGCYNRENDAEIANHWITETINMIFDQFNTMSNFLRPNYERYPITPLVFPNENFNPYDYILNYSPANVEMMTQFANKMNCYLTNLPTSRSIHLLDLIGKATGITIMTHTIEPATLPTWHTHRVIRKLKPDNTIKMIEFDKYAEFSQFLLPKADYESKLFEQKKEICSSCEKLEDILLISNTKHERGDEPYKMMVFDISNHVAPPVYVYQPHSRDQHRVARAISLGLKIEVEEFDAVGLPLVNFRDSLYDNNDTYAMGSIPINHIRPVLMNTSENAAVRIMERERRSFQTTAYALRNGGRVTLPNYDNDGLILDDINAIEWLPGHEVEYHADDPRRSYTWTASKLNEPQPRLAYSRHLWSSYRRLDNAQTMQSAVHMYFTLNGLYGTSVPLLRIINPISLFPRI